MIYVSRYLMTKQNARKKKNAQWSFGVASNEKHCLSHNAINTNHRCEVNNVNEIAIQRGIQIEKLWVKTWK